MTRHRPAGLPAACLAASLLVVSPLWSGREPRAALAQPHAAALPALAKLRGPEREQRLVEGARREGSLVWYSSADTDDALALIKRFTDRYPFVRVEHFRAPSEKLLERILAEWRARAFRADVVSLPEIELHALAKQGVLVPFESPEQDAYPPEMKDPRDLWTGMYVSAWVCMYNTKLVPKEAAPRRYRDLLDPRWKGQITLDPEAYSWFVTSLRYLEQRDGPEAALDYFKRLARQDVQFRKGHSLIAQLVAAGEVPVAPEIQVHNVEALKSRGAPVDWVALDGVIPVHRIGLALTTVAPSPHAAALFYDFILSRSGMEAIRARHRVPARPDVTVPYLAPYRLLPFEPRALDEFDRYVALFRDIFKPGL
ncbi:MAG TPA: ABC transporter substrate-binding protein [Thermodesulfobacteriota bacterium]|nr:ABC transporter substrate-binding protein [Thermodesulfobacteriota bacterium]